jgi:soluble lytic murein transglycosylase-like protein
MDATGAIIILLFVVTIFSTSMGGGMMGGPQVHSRVDNATLPDPTYMAVIGEDAKAKIQNYILTFTSKVNVWDASKMAYSMVKYGEQYNVNPKLVAALVCRESAYNKNAVSPTGAEGLGQLLPSTAKSLKVTNSFDIDQNLYGTTRYVRLMLDRWDGNPQQVPLALASYAEGYGAVTRNGGYKSSTRKYIEDIIRYYWKI